MTSIGSHKLVKSIINTYRNYKKYNENPLSKNIQRTQITKCKNYICYFIKLKPTYEGHLKYLLIAKLNRGVFVPSDENRHNANDYGNFELP